MQRRAVTLALGLASMSGLLAAVGVNDWMTSQADRMKELAQQPTPAPEAIVIPMTKVVVAKDNIGFGIALTKENLIEVDYPTESVPRGTFQSIAEFLSERGERVALAPFGTKEPIIKERVTGPGQRSGLATLLESGKKAVSFKVNEAVSVGGLVLPGDVVDILVTNDVKDFEDGSNGRKKNTSTDVLLQKVHVLAIDQTFNPTQTQPIIGRTVTVAATLGEAQMITLAASIGQLSLVLRGSNQDSQTLPRLTVADLPGNSGDKSDLATMIPTKGVANDADTDARAKDTKGEPDPSAGSSAVKSDMAKVSVIRATTPTDYSVVRREKAE